MENSNSTGMSTQNKITLFIVVVLIVVAIVYLNGKKVHFTSSTASTTPLALMGDQTVASSTPLAVSSTTPSSASTNPSDIEPLPTALTPVLSAAQISQIRATKAAQYPSAVEFVDPSGFINTPSGAPISLKDYIGKDVILIDFMTYSCINCQRTFPYITAFYSKYKDQGLVVIGIHTPEFDFEKVYSNVAAAMKRFGITYPVVMDNDYGTWNAYQNQYWPHEYLIDIDGYVVHDQIGEGGYQDTEQKIKDALKERDTRFGLPVPSDVTDSSFVSPTGTAGSVEADSPETYFGSNRNTYLGNGTPGQIGMQTFTLPNSSTTPFANNTFYFGGWWNVQPEYAQSQGAGSTFVYNYTAKDLYFVASNAVAGTPIKATVTLDGKPIPKAMQGSDVMTDSSGNTYITVSSSRLYNIIAGSDMETHTIQITAESSGLQAFTLTFG